MPHQPKIATCCYCGTRAALVLGGQVRHELSCSTCGAPLHELKRLRSDSRGERELVDPSPIRAPREAKKAKSKKGKRRKSRRGWLAYQLKELADDVFDFDDILDIFD